MYGNCYLLSLTFETISMLSVNIYILRPILHIKFWKMRGTDLIIVSGMVYLTLPAVNNLLTYFHVKYAFTSNRRI